MTLCDLCNGAAIGVWQAYNPDAKDRPLFFCTHHKREYEPALTSAGWTIDKL